MLEGSEFCCILMPAFDADKFQRAPIAVAARMRLLEQAAPDGIAAVLGDAKEMLRAPALRRLAVIGQMLGHGMLLAVESLQSSANRPISQMAMWPPASFRW